MVNRFKDVKNKSFKMDSPVKPGNDSAFLTPSSSGARLSSSGLTRGSNTKLDQYIRRLWVGVAISFVSLGGVFGKASLVGAQEAPLAISGYYKNIFNASKSAVTDESLSSVTQRLRVELFKEYGPWSVNMTVDNEALFSDFANRSDLDFIRSKTQDTLATIDADKVSVDNDHVYLRHAVYRAYVKYYKPSFQAVLGKQAVDWGKMRFYSPMDVFNTLGPIDIEPDERVGVDAINLNFSPEAFGGINLVAVPGKNDEETSFGLRLYKTLGTYDMNVIAASTRKDVTFGFAFDGYLKEAGLRGEVTHTRLDNGRDFARVSVGLDYTFSEKFYALFEQFYNGGADDNDATGFTGSFKTSTQIRSLKKNISNGWLNYKITPLVTFNTYALYDWDGKSIAINPEIIHNVTKNVDVTAGVQGFWGAADSEFGIFENLFYFIFKFYF